MGFNFNFKPRKLTYRGYDIVEACTHYDGYAGHQLYLRTADKIIFRFWGGCGTPEKAMAKAFDADLDRFNADMMQMVESGPLSGGLRYLSQPLPLESVTDSLPEGFAEHHQTASI